MSGGFFRGTSADQDTRFSNKEAKLLKSQKFPAELDQLVDMSKVKMDVIRPWIASRTTEFLGFEDEVLINFIYGLLDGKDVDGKQIQIQLTGFMEKNTGKFMKELWGLLTSAQKNASGIPQQFLDAKAEETRKKKAETDRINYEIQKKKEQEEREVEQERQNKINAELETAKVAAAAAVSAKASLKSNPDDEMAEERRSSRARGRNGDSRLSHDGDHSPLSHRSVSSSSRSKSRSYSFSRSPSRSPVKRRHRSRSNSRSPRHRRRSPSPIRRPRSPKYSPPRRKRSPLYARSPRRRSPSPWRRRPQSPLRRRRSPSPPRRRRSPSPPLKRRSPSPPPRKRSPSPPPRRRSPSPPPRRSPSPPLKLRSPAPRLARYNRRSPVRSPKRRQMGSQSPRWRKRSLSREHSSRYGEVDPRRYQDRNASERMRAKRSPEREQLDRVENEYERREHPRGGQTLVKMPPPRHSSPIHCRSPQRDARMHSGGPSKMPVSPPYQSSPDQSPSSQRITKAQMNEEIRQLSPYHRKIGSTRESPEPRKKLELNTRIMENVDHRVDRVEMLNKRVVQAPHVSERKEYGPRRAGFDRESPNDLPVIRSGEKLSRQEGAQPKRKEYHTRGSFDYPKRRDFETPYASEEIEYGPGILDHGHPLQDHYPDNRSGANRPGTILRSHIEYDDEKDNVGLRRSPSRDSFADDDINAYKVDAVRKPIPKPESMKHMVGSGSDSEENDGYKRKYIEKRKTKREEIADKIMNDDEDGSVSPRSNEERRETKRRKKEEKRLRKEEKRRRREERHKRKEERRAIKAKAKALLTVAPPERDYSAAEDSEDDCHDMGRSRQSHDEEMEDEQKRLEIELRRKALESLRAKKAISH